MNKGDPTPQVRTNKVRRLGYSRTTPHHPRILIQVQSKYNYVGSQYRVTKVKFAGSRKPNRTKKGGGREENCGTTSASGASVVVVLEPCLLVRAEVAAARASVRYASSDGSH